jgi:Matrixin
MFATRLIALSAAILFGATQAHGFVREFDDHGVSLEWNKNRTVLMHLSLPAGGPMSDGAPSFNAVAEAALNIWNQFLVHMKFAVDRNSILPPSEYDSNVSVQMSATVYGDGFGTNTLATTLLFTRDNHFMETDVTFNSKWSWDSYRGSLSNGTVDFRRVALHEFGHVVGLDHPDQASPKQTVMAIMNSIVSDIDNLQQDDINGAKSIYDSGPAFLNSVPAPNLVNLSTRAVVGLGENAVIGGFIIQGSQPATVILRGIGNSLPAFGITTALKDPVIELHSTNGGTDVILATSDDWIDDSWAGTIASYHLDPSNSQESAILATLNPGTYTVVVRSFDNGDGDLTGTAVVELYDLHTTGGRAGNISTRGQVQSGDQLLIGGFIVGGTQAKPIVVRALGPSLGAAGITNPLGDPAVELRDASGAVLASNDNWGSSPNAAQIQSENLAPSNPSESAFQVTLNPGSYTAIVRGANGTTGVGLVEIYDLSPVPN